MVENRGTQFYLDEIQDMSIMMFPRSTQTDFIQNATFETVSTCTNKIDRNTNATQTELNQSVEIQTAINSTETIGTITDITNFTNVSAQTDISQTISTYTEDIDTDTKLTQTELHQSAETQTENQATVNNETEATETYMKKSVQSKFAIHNKFLLPNLISGTLLALAGIWIINVANNNCKNPNLKNLFFI